MSQGKRTRKVAKNEGFGPKRANYSRHIGRRYPSSLPWGPMKPKGSPARCPAEIRQGRGHMAEDTVTTTGIARHGATRLPSVEVDSFNIELKDDDGFLGDRAR